MPNNEKLKKQIIYRATHRGYKEMDLLLGSFVGKYIDNFNNNELEDLKNLLLIEDNILDKWYFKNESDNLIPNNKVSILLKNFKL